MVDYHKERGGLPLHDAVDGKKLATTEIKTQVPNIWAKECIVDNCVCVI